MTARAFSKRTVYHCRTVMNKNKMRQLPRLLYFLGAAGCGGVAHAADAPAMDTDVPTLSAPHVWLNPGIYSYHFDRSKNFRENNIGFGAEVLFAEDHELMGGTFINSDRARSHYAAYQWRPLHWKPFDGVKVNLGVAVGGFDGYPRYHNGGWFAAALPVLSVEGRRIGANIFVIPTISDRLAGAVAVQVKLRVW
jgi:hypothetical protein